MEIILTIRILYIQYYEYSITTVISVQYSSRTTCTVVTLTHNGFCSYTIMIHIQYIHMHTVHTVVSVHTYSTYIVSYSYYCTCSTSTTYVYMTSTYSTYIYTLYIIIHTYIHTYILYIHHTPYIQ